MIRESYLGIKFTSVQVLFKESNIRVKFLVIRICNLNMSMQFEYEYAIVHSTNIFTENEPPICIIQLTLDAHAS